MHQRPKDNTGFTTIEFLIVISILITLVTIAIAEVVGWIPGVKVNSAARDLVSEMQLARMEAVSKRNDYVITFDTTNNRYSIYNDSNNNFATAGAESGELIKSVDLPSGIQFGYISGVTGPDGNAISGSIAFGSSRETFKPNGTAIQSGTVYLIPTKDIAIVRKDRQRAVTVLQTGRVKLFRHDPGRTPPWR